MKSLLLTLASVIIFQISSAQYCGNFGNPSGPTQCTPSGTLTVPGLSPPSEVFPPFVNGDASSTTIQFKNWDTISFSGTLLTVQTLRFDSIGNLPAGLCWATNVANNTF